MDKFSLQSVKKIGSAAQHHRLCIIVNSFMHDMSTLDIRLFTYANDLQSSSCAAKLL